MLCALQIVMFANMTYFSQSVDCYKGLAVISQDFTISAPAVIHWNSTEHVRPPTIYMCGDRNGANGFRETKKILLSALPEYTFSDLGAAGVGRNRRLQLPPEYFWPKFTNPYDIFITTFEFNDCNNELSSWLFKYFNGHFLLFSPESQKSHPINHALGNRAHYHAFGPLLNPRSTDMMLTYLQFVWWDKFQYILTPQTLKDPTVRPRGTLQNFMVYANSNCVQFREKAVARLSELGVIHCEGKCQGTRGVPNDTPMNRTHIVDMKGRHKINIGNWWENVGVYSDYQFCFVMEHEIDHPNYITEKILMAFSAGCLPIYYGPSLIFDMFNAKAFVFYNVSDPQPALDQIKALRDNEDLYEAMLNETIIANGEETIEKYFSFNNSIGGGRLKRKIREKFGLTDGVFVP